VPSVFPLSPSWRFILFGLGAIQFARHPEGLVEAGKRRAHHRVEQIAARLRRDRHDDGAPGAPAEPAPVGEPVG
jgi:hypothetical protein